jgi:cytochrome c553
MKFISISVLVLLLLSGCKQNSSEYDLISLNREPVKEIQEHPGKKLMETYCYTCHSPTAPMNEGRIGPPMAAVKAHYLMNYPNKEEFIDHIVAFVEEPTVEKSEMRGAIKRFGLMPYQQFPDGAVEKIAEYLYEYQVKEPEWFAEHWKEGPGKGKYRQQGQSMKKGMGNGMGKREKGMGRGMGMQRQNGAEKGMEIALGTKKVLGQNLMGAIQTKGTIHAMEFCSTQAMSLTDSMAQKYNATVQRVTNKTRNPMNEVTSAEAELVEYFAEQVKAGEDPQPILIPQNGSTRFYYPIVTNSMCLQCHGKPGDIEPQVKEKILKIYPQDEAIGYSENEVRGIWKINLRIDGR